MHTGFSAALGRAPSVSRLQRRASRQRQPGQKITAGSVRSGVSAHPRARCDLLDRPQFATVSAFGRNVGLSLAFPKRSRDSSAGFGPVLLIPPGRFFVAGAMRPVVTTSVVRDWRRRPPLRLTPDPKAPLALVLGIHCDHHIVPTQGGDRDRPLCPCTGWPLLSLGPRLPPLINRGSHRRAGIRFRCVECIAVLALG